MYKSEDVLEAARVIQPYLPDLLGTEAATVDQALASKVAKVASGEVGVNSILELLAERDTTREWTQKFLIDKMPPPVMRNYDPLAGSQSIIDANTFICEVPDCPGIWHRPKAGIAPPLCPEHKISLVPAQSQTA